MLIKGNYWLEVTCCDEFNSSIEHDAKGFFCHRCDDSLIYDGETDCHSYAIGYCGGNVPIFQSNNLKETLNRWETIPKRK